MRDNIMSATKLKQEAHRLIDQLPDDATWDDLVYEVTTRREIELGLADSENNKISPVEDVFREFSIEE
jgi:hypothetical protein